ncbi:MAG: DUF4430 domain-containing protein [Lactimicrobium sp.]|jgi:hypothetical protein|uniref:DUF4430 domain-containing protein n=1 Tax=Lactimicrobium sp. TaxID=2563780 RepID=UPI002F35BE9C
MKKKNRKITAAIIIVAAIAILLVVYNVFKPKTVKGEKAYTLEVINQEGEETDYKGTTDQEYLRGVMDELVKDQDFSYDGMESQSGFYITEVNGETADYTKDSAYWSIMVNGDYGSYGIDQQPVADGDDFQLVYTTDQK